MAIWSLSQQASQGVPSKLTVHYNKDCDLGLPGGEVPIDDGQN